MVAAARSKRERPPASAQTGRPSKTLRPIALGEGLERLAVDGDLGLGGGHVAVEATEDRVVLQQVGQGGVVGEVVDADDLDVGARRGGGAEEVAADAAEAVDPYADSHWFQTFPGWIRVA